MSATENPQVPPEPDDGTTPEAAAEQQGAPEPQDGTAPDTTAEQQGSPSAPGAEGAAPADPDAGEAEGLTVEDILAAAEAAATEEAPVSDEAAEHLAQLQRLNAEYANYRKRTEREKEALAEVVKAGVLKSLLPVLDDLSRAEAHGDLAEGPFAVIAQKLRGALEQQGLAAFGEKGDAFDPQIHEALVQLPSAEVERDTVADVVETGYTLGERLIRPAKVAVATPAA